MCCRGNVLQCGRKFEGERTGRVLPERCADRKARTFKPEMRFSRSTKLRSPRMGPLLSGLSAPQLLNKTAKLTPCLSVWGTRSLDDLLLIRLIMRRLISGGIIKYSFSSLRNLRRGRFVGHISDNRFSRCEPCEVRSMSPYHPYLFP